MGPATDKHQAPIHRLKFYVRAVIESKLLLLIQKGINFKGQNSLPLEQILSFKSSTNFEKGHDKTITARFSNCVHVCLLATLVYSNSVAYYSRIKSVELLSCHS